MSKNIQPVTVADLPDLLGSHLPVFLLCDECFEQNSAHAGDYWDRPERLDLHALREADAARQERDALH